MYCPSQQSGSPASKTGATSKVFWGLKIVYGDAARRGGIATLFKNSKKRTKINSISCGLFEDAVCLC